MPRAALDDLTRQVTGYFRKHASRYGLRRETLQALYILNWGGYVNASFTLTDGETNYHLKLADDPETQDQLARWHDLTQPLAERYHAPLILEWVEIPRTDFAGLLFPHLPGVPADLAAQPEILQGVLELLARLHADRALAQALAEEDEPTPTCADYFIGAYIDRFDEDLLAVAGSLPPFVSLPLLDWMMGETRELEGLARDDPAFQHPADAPVHGDLWENNILVGPDGQWYIIDWDDLALGDPALEYSLLLARLFRQGQRSQAELEALLPADAGLRRRFDLCLRASLLDQVIDSLADWVESDFAPEHQAQVRAEKERIHTTTLALYRQLYHA